MRRNLFIFCFLTAGSALLISNGCQEQASVAEDSKAIQTKPNETVADTPEVKKNVISINESNKPSPKIEFEKPTLYFRKWFQFLRIHVDSNTKSAIFFIKAQRKTSNVNDPQPAVPYSARRQDLYNIG